jgi:hypothetical protein
MTDVSGSALLQRAADMQKRCDEQAQRWRYFLLRVRMTVLLLGLFTATLGAVIASLGVTKDSSVGFALKLGTVMLPLAAALLTLLLGKLNMTRQWVAFRAASETLKTEAFLFATRAEKYIRDDRERVLQRRLDAIELELTRKAVSS